MAFTLLRVKLYDNRFDFVEILVDYLALIHIINA